MQPHNDQLPAALLVARLLNCIINPMTALLKEAIACLQRLDEEDQNRAAAALLAFVDEQSTDMRVIV